MTSIPIDRAVPRTLLIAVSTEAAFRSGIFCLAMSSTCLAVTLPTLSLFGMPDPLAMPAARFNRIEAGGVLVMKVNDAVAVNRYHDRDDQPFHFLLVGAGIELLAELHDVDLRLAQRRAHRGRRRRLARRDLQLHLTCNFFCHCIPLSSLQSRV